MTDKAFHKNWYLLQPSVKRIFVLIIMANNLECKITAFKNFNLSLPSFMVVKFYTFFNFLCIILLSYFRSNILKFFFSDFKSIVFDCPFVFKNELKCDDKDVLPTVTNQLLLPTNNDN